MPHAQQNTALQRTWRLRVVPLLTLVVGSVLSYAAYTSVHELEDKRVVSQFELAASNSLSMLRDAAEHNVLSLASIRTFAQEAGLLRGRTFGDFVRPFFGYLSGLRLLGWVSVEGPADGFGQESAGVGHCRVELIEPEAGNARLLGCDLGDDPALLKALREARDSGEASMTCGLRLRSRTDQGVFWIVLPVYEDDAPAETIQQRREALEGYVFGEFEFRGFVEDSLRPLVPQGIDVWLKDPGAEPAMWSLHVHRSRLRTDPVDSDRLRHQLEHPQLVRTESLQMPGRRWEVQASPSPDALAAWSTVWVSKTLLTIGLLLSLLLSAYLNVILSRATQIERLVRARTAELKASEETAHVLLDAAEEAAYLLDIDGRVLAANEAGYRGLGCSPQDLTGAPFQRWFGPQRARPVERLMIQSIRLVLPVSLEQREGQAHYEYRCLPIRNAAGKIWRFALFISDTTDRRRREEAARRHHEELAHASRLSTIGEMASGLAHELNQPLGAICANVDACKRQVAARQYTDLEETVEDVAAQAERAAAIVQRVRRFIGKQPIQSTAVDLNSVIRESVGLSLTGAAKSEMHIDLRLEDDLPSVIGDTIQLQQVMVNLIRNAFEAMASSTKESRRLVIQSEVQGESTVLVSVADTGPGLDLAVPERIFDPFFTTKPDGMGMGLTISQSIIRHHQGCLWVEVSPGQGTTFHITLPSQTGEPHEPLRADSVHCG